jgi:S1-C subfamily serine protease
VSGEDESNVSLYVQDGNKKLIATVVKHHPYIDMAVIKVQGKLEGKTATTKIASINMQDQIYIVGNPLHNKMIYTEGVMAGYTDTSLLIQAPCIFGSSGSGIYNTNGELVGLVYALQMYPGFMGIPMAQITHTVAVDSVHIKGFLTDLGLYNAE